MPLCTTPELCPVWWVAGDCSLSRTITSRPVAASPRATARPRMPAPTTTTRSPRLVCIPGSYAWTRLHGAGTDDHDGGLMYCQRPPEGRDRELSCIPGVVLRHEGRRGCASSIRGPAGSEVREVALTEVWGTPTHLDEILSNRGFEDGWSTFDRGARALAHEDGPLADEPHVPVVGCWSDDDHAATFQRPELVRELVHVVHPQRVVGGRVIRWPPPLRSA